MAAALGDTAAPTPRSPPKYPDFCGRRRLQLEVHILNRELGYLEQEELQSIEGLQPVSRCCKEVHEFVATNPDPLIPPNKKRHGSCYCWKWLGSKVFQCFSCICCCAGFSCECKRPSCSCCPHPKKPCFGDCSCGCLRSCCPELSCCRLPRSCCSCKPCSCCKWPSCCSWSRCRCRPPRCCSCRGVSCCKMLKWCCSPTISCPEYSCGCVFDCPKCTEVRLCPKCTRPCCVTGCLC